MDWDSFGININGENLNHLRFSDDLTLISETPSESQEMLLQHERESKIVGLTMNTEKRKLMSNHTKTPISLNNNNIEYVDQDTYLGQIISPEDKCKKK